MAERRLVAANLGRLILLDCPRVEAIGHALWEARQCIEVQSYCACLSMLRKAVDLWSKQCQEQLENSSSAIEFSSSERGNLKPRLEKIAATNLIYADTIHVVIDALRDDANNGVHGDSSCAVMDIHSQMLDHSRAEVRHEAEELCVRVEGLVAGTMPGVKPTYGDTDRAREVASARATITHGRARERKTLKPPPVLR